MAKGNGNAVKIVREIDGVLEKLKVRAENFAVLREGKGHNAVYERQSVDADGGCKTVDDESIANGLIRQVRGVAPLLPNEELKVVIH